MALVVNRASTCQGQLVARHRLGNAAWALARESLPASAPPAAPALLEGRKGRFRCTMRLCLLVPVAVCLLCLFGLLGSRLPHCAPTSALEVEVRY